MMLINIAKIGLTIIIIIFANINCIFADIDSFEKATPMVKHILESLDIGKYENVTQDFNENLIKELAVEDIADFWEEIKVDIGDLVSYDKVSLRFEEETSIFEYRAKFTDAELILTIAFDKNEKISGLHFQPAVVNISGEERNTVLKEIKPVIENILVSLDKGDIKKVSADFDAAMIKAMPAAKIKELQKIIKNNIGRYISYEPDILQRQDQYILTSSNAKYSKEENVTVKISFGNNYKVIGLWFSSDKLKEFSSNLKAK